MKNYSKDKLIEGLSRCDFPNYSTFTDINNAYSDFIERTSEVINKIAPMKVICVKNNTAELVDEEVLDGIKTMDKLFRKFKKSRSNIDNINYKKTRIQLGTNKKEKEKLCTV